MKNNISWMIGGRAGFGIISSGFLISKAFMRAGYNLIANDEYESLIRGGHNSYKIRVDEKEIFSPAEKVDMLAALDADTIQKHMDEINDNGVIVCDKKNLDFSEIKIKKGIKIIDVPLKEISAEAGSDLYKNSVIIGATLSLLNMDLKIIEDVILEHFGKKGEEIGKKNILAAKKGYDYVKKNKLLCDMNVDMKKTKKGEVLINGNEAISAGAIKAGCKFTADYPMTPASSIYQFIAKFEEQYDIVVKQTEDEIAAVNMAIGASHCGVRSLVATSGGGFCLMTEGVGLAGSSETGIVIVNSQRAGPSTGMPTRTEQSDLRFVLHSSHGDFPKIVLAVGDIYDCYYRTIEAFELAEKYQVPVIILTDKYLAEGYKCNALFKTEHKNKRCGFLKDNEIDDNYMRYKITANGVSPRTIPGQKKGMFRATGNEHTERGNISEDINNRNAQMQKRMRKLENAKKEIGKNAVEIFGDANADVSIICWGSVKGIAKDAIMQLKEEGIKANMMQIVYFSPFPDKEVHDFTNKARKTVMFENNYTGQLRSLIKEQCMIDVDKSVNKYDGRAFERSQICNEVKVFLKNG